MKRKIQGGENGLSRRSISPPLVYLVVGSLFLTGFLVVYLSQLRCFDLRKEFGKRMVYLTSQERGSPSWFKNSRRITNFLSGLSNQKLLRELTIVLARVSVEIFRPFEMVKWGCIYSENGGSG